MTYAFLKRMYGTAFLDVMMNVLEFAPHVDSAWDPYAAVQKVGRLFFYCGVRACGKRVC
jgi:hypothetical protein